MRWDSNFVWTDPPLEGVGADELAADADDILGRAGLEHRVIWVADAGRDERLAPGFADLGYKVDRNVVMVHAREPDRWTDDRAEEVDLESAKRMWFVSHLEEAAEGEGSDVAQRLTDFLDVLVDDAGCGFFGVRVDGEVVAEAQLMMIDDVAQIEDVVTLHRARRGQGSSRCPCSPRSERRARSGRT